MDWSYVSMYPGVSVAYSDGKFMQTACRGYSDIERQITITENTLFPACSIGAVMINIDPEVSQEESGLEKMVSALLYGDC